MFCCAQQALLLTLADHPLDYNNDQLYDRQPRHFIRDSPHSHPIANECAVVETPSQALEFEPKNSQEALLSIELEEPSQSLKLTYRPKSPHEPIWRVLTNQEAHPLHKGDKVKIGMTEFTIYSHHSPSTPAGDEKVKKRKESCRYCLNCEYSAADPLVSLCRCAGSSKYIHLGCLRDWLMTRMDKETHGNVTFYV